MSTMPIQIRADFLRVAHAFTYGASGVFTDSKLPCDQVPIRGVYVEPHPCGTGVQIVSTDGCALCVQWDQKGKIDRGRLITGLTKSACLEFSGSDLNANWVIGDPEKFYLQKDGKKKVRLEGVAAWHTYIINDPDCPPGGPKYPGWRHLVPKDLDSLTPGFPGLINVAYLSIIGTLYRDGLQNVRHVRVLSHIGDPNLPVVLQFPWRSNTMVIIAPLKDDPGMWADSLTRIISDEPFVQQDSPASTFDDDGDPAAGL